MAERPSLLAHLSPRLADGEENLATESLNFVLHRSLPVRHAFTDLLGRVLNRSLPGLTYRTQAADADGTIPDLVGVDVQGRSVVFVEAKFWAGLTDSQPVGYLQRLAREEGVGLVFLAPANRMATLWPELCSLCKRAGLEPASATAAEHSRADLCTGPPMAATSWSAVMSELVRAATTAGDIAAAEDLRQLQGLCHNMEQSGFLPLRREELTGNVARRIREYCRLVDDLVTTLKADGVATLERAKVTGGSDRLKATGGSGYYLRSMWLGAYGVRIEWNARLWAKIFPTPLWLNIYSAKFKRSREAREALRSKAAAYPPEAFIDVDPWGGVLVPLDLPIGSERHVVLASLVQQVKAVSKLLPAIDASVMPDSEPISDTVS